MNKEKSQNISNNDIKTTKKPKGFWGINRKHVIDFAIPDYRDFYKNLNKYLSGISHVKVLAEKKKNIAQDILDGKLIIQDIPKTTLISLFTKKEIESVLSHMQGNSSRKIERTLRDNYLLKIQSLEIKNEDIPDLIKIFGRLNTYKIIIYFNNLAKKKKRLDLLLLEDENIIQIREKIEYYFQRKNNYKKYLDLFKSLEKQKFQSKESFFEKLEEIGFLDIFQSIDWRDRPYLLKYAIGDNGDVSRPFGKDEAIRLFECESKYKSYLKQYLKEFNKVFSDSKQIYGIKLNNDN